MLSKILFVVIATVLAALAPVQAQGQSGDSPPPIATDRPAVTNSSVVVPAGSIQAETGFLKTRSNGQRVINLPETLLALGVTKRTELRFTVPDYLHNWTSGVGSGWGDFGLGVKQQLGPCDASTCQ